MIVEKIRELMECAKDRLFKRKHVAFWFEENSLIVWYKRGSKCKYIVGMSDVLTGENVCYKDTKIATKMEALNFATKEAARIRDECYSRYGKISTTHITLDDVVDKNKSYERC